MTPKSIQITSQNHELSQLSLIIIFYLSLIIFRNPSKSKGSDVSPSLYK